MNCTNYSCQVVMKIIFRCFSIQYHLIDREDSRRYCNPSLEHYANKQWSLWTSNGGRKRDFFLSSTRSQPSPSGGGGYKSNFTIWYISTIIFFTICIEIEYVSLKVTLMLVIVRFASSFQFHYLYQIFFSFDSFWDRGHNLDSLFHSTVLQLMSKARLLPINANRILLVDTYCAHIYPDCIGPWKKT